MKEIYTSPECEIILFDNTDVLNASNEATVNEDGSVGLPTIGW